MGIHFTCFMDGVTVSLLCDYGEALRSPFRAVKPYRCRRRWMRWAAGGCDRALNSRKSGRKGLGALFIFPPLTANESSGANETFSQSKGHSLPAADLPWHWVLNAFEELSGSSNESPLQLLPLLCAGERMHAWTEQGVGSWRGRARRDVVQGTACLPITDPITPPSSANLLFICPLCFLLITLILWFLAAQGKLFQSSSP